MKLWCSICGEQKEGIEHFKIYVNGSEGLNLCPACKMDVTEYCRNKRRENSKRKLREYIK